MDKIIVTYNAKECVFHDGVACKHDGLLTSPRRCEHCQNMDKTPFKKKDLRAW